MTGTLILKRSDVAALLDLESCIASVEQAFRMHHEGATLPPGVLGVPSTGGGFHIKAAGLKLDRVYFAAKVNANFSENKKRFGLPAIQGVVLLCDGESGYPLALKDSIEITIIRTGAATAVAAKYLARPDSRVATIAGCGNQGRIQLKSLLKVLNLDLVYAFDRDEAMAQTFARDIRDETGLDVRPVRDLAEAAPQSDVVVTCTPSREPFLRVEHVRPGTFIAAVGADSEDKQELDPGLLAANTVVVDLIEQCAAIGELHHALKKGLMEKGDVHAELAEVISGGKAGRSSSEEIIVFDSTGTALQDVAAAAVVYRKALEEGLGTPLNFAD